MKRTHGRSHKNDKTYLAWCNMKTRCNNKNFKDAATYSEIGITYDPAWESFEQFLADVGEAPEGTMLDRRNNNEGYSKDNCRWVSAAVSARNRSNVKLDVEKVLVIKQRLKQKPTYLSHNAWNKAIGKDYGVSATVINQIRLGNNWVDVK